MFIDYKGIVDRSCLFNGIGGSGKSFTLLKMLGHIKNYLLIAPTHTAVSRLKKEGIDASTIDSALKVCLDGFSKPKYTHHGQCLCIRW